MPEEPLAKVDRLSRAEVIRRIDAAGEGAVVLLEGARALPPEWRPKLVEIAERLAKRFPLARFRSGNAPGSDEAFSWGVHRIDPRRFEYVVPYAAHRKEKRNPVSYSAAIGDVSEAKLREIVDATGEATPLYDRIARGYEERPEEMSARSKASARLLLRDTMKVLARISHERPAAKPQAAQMRRCKPISDIDVFQYAFSRKFGLRLASERPVASRDDLHEKCGLGSDELGLAKPVVGIFFVNEENPFKGGTGHTMRVCLEHGVPVVTQFSWAKWL